MCIFFFSSRRRHTRFDCDWSSDVCSSDLVGELTKLGLMKEAGLKVFNEREAKREYSYEQTRATRSEERRVGKECRARWSAYHQKKNRHTTRILVPGHTPATVLTTYARRHP